MDQDYLESLVDLSTKVYSPEQDETLVNKKPYVFTLKTQKGDD